MKKLPLAFLIVVLCGAADTFQESPLPPFTHHVAIGEIGDFDCNGAPSVTPQGGNRVFVSLVTTEGASVQIWSVDTVIVEQIVPGYGE